MSKNENTFDPVEFSIAENNFLLSSLGMNPVAALSQMPPSVNRRAVEPVLRKVYDFEALKKHDGSGWCGVEALKEKIVSYLRENAKWKADAARSKRAPRYPSMYSFDGKGRAHRGGIGSDSGRVRTYFDQRGNRVPFEIPYVGEEHDLWAPPGFTEQSTSPGLRVDNDQNRIECLNCGHTESFKAESRSSYNAARARMSKHLRKASTKVDEHRETYANEFGG